MYGGYEATLKMWHGTADWVEMWKEYVKAAYCHLCLFNFYAEYIMRHAALDEAQTGIQIVGRNINNLKYAGDTYLW